jgi:hypothetical protein
MGEQLHFLEFPCEELNISQEFRLWLSNNRFKNFKELLKYSANELLLMEGFGYIFLKELYSILEESGVEYKLKQS